MRAVIVEEDPGARTVLIDLLAAAGVEVASCETFCEAVRALMRQRFQMLVLDLHQSGVPCETALSLLRQVAPDVSVVLTARDPVGRLASRAACAGAFRVLAKPFDAAEIRRVVEGVQSARGLVPS